MTSPKKITWTPKQQKLSELKEWEKNPRKITGEAFERLKQRISDRGFHDVVKVDTDNVILSGTQRRKALEAIGVTEVWTMVPDRKLTESERKAVVLESNRNEGEDDWEKLRAYFDKGELMAGGFPKDEISKFFDIMSSAEEDGFDADSEANKIVKAISKVGDRWIMGGHILVCGDSTDPKVYEKLFGKEEKADCVFTDPPYNVNYDYTSKYTDNRVGRKERARKFAGGTKVFNDKQTPKAFREFLFKMFENAYAWTKDSAGIYVCHATKSQAEFFGAFLDAGWHFSQTIIWLKERMILALGQDYHRIYEPIMYGWKKGNKRWSNKGLATETEVWAADRVTFEEHLDVWYMHRDKSALYEHPTQKPVKLPERGIKKSCPRGGIVLEPFGGSGSTLLACEQLERRCFTIELDPRYADVIVKRWQRFTKKQAQCEGRPEAVVIDQV